MAQIRIDTERAAEVARRLVAAGNLVNQIGGELQSAIGSLDTWAWDGHSRARAEPLLSQVRPESQRLGQELDTLGRKLARAAAAFEQEDNTAAGNLAGMPWVEFETGAGVVLGVAAAAGAPAVILASLPSTGEGIPNLSTMSWADRFAYAEVLPGQIQTLEQSRQAIQSQIDKDNQDVAALEQQIRDLQARRDALQEEADDWWNKIRRDPDVWRWGFDDRFPDAPWRTKSDALEDEIAECDRQIGELQAQQDTLLRLRQSHQRELDGVNQQLTALRRSQVELSRMIQDGVPFDGPSAKSPYFPAGNCTRYAASRRNVPCSGHAHQWNEQAQAGGYEVGNYPLRGSVMVWEKTVKGADPTYGHVAIVERVERLDDGRLRVWYTDNRNQDAANPSHRDIRPGEAGISFIYDKHPGSTPTI